MAMPKTSVDENDRFVLRQDEVRPPGKLLSMKPEAIAKAVE
jgi:hypothetical protein